MNKDVAEFRHLFAIGWSVFGGAYILAITFLSIPATNLRFADTILGFLLGTLITTLINFFYGSSSGSKEKDAALANKEEPHDGTI